MEFLLQPNSSTEGNETKTANMKTAYKLLSVTKSNLIRMIKLPMQEAINIEELVKPETELETQILNNPEIRKGLMWGKPRYGHPEGEVVLHVREVLNNIEALSLDAQSRRKLRLITIVHDTFKYAESKTYPRDWSKHHSMLARHFMAAYTEEQDVLDIIELHDEAYYAWRLLKLYGKEDAGTAKLNNLLKRLGDNLMLYYYFFKCDTQTGDKIQAPLRWFEEEVLNNE